MYTTNDDLPYRLKNDIGILDDDKIHSFIVMSDYIPSNIVDFLDIFVADN